MKKNLLILSILLVSFYKSKSQSIQLLDTTGGAMNQAQSSYTFWVDNDSACNYMFAVKNLTSSQLTIKVKKHVISNVGSNSITFCIGSLCYGATTTLSGSVTIPANSFIPPVHPTPGTFGLSTEFAAMVASGTAQVMYTIFNANNVNDSVSVTINYNLTAAGIKSIATNYFVSNISPNPANTNVSVNYDLKNTLQPASIKIYNMLGTLVKTVSLETYSNNTKIDITSLEEGIYFYSVIVGEKPIKTSRLVVSR